MTNEVFESILQELSFIKDKLPNGELKLLISSIKDMKEDISELKYMLLNPEDGVIVKTNKNSEAREELSRKITILEMKSEEIADLRRWKENVSKALWIVFTVLTGIVVQMISTSEMVK